METGSPGQRNTTDKLQRRRADTMPNADEPPHETPQQPSSEQIERRAYELYLERGMTDGGDLDDWLRATAELARNRRES